MIKRKTIIIVLIISTKLLAQVDSIGIEPTKHPYWTFLVPGASYFNEGKIAQGVGFSILELGGIYIGIRYDDNLNNDKTTPYYNYPLFIGVQAFQIEKLNYFRKLLEVRKYKYPEFLYDELSDKELYLAPFKKKNIFTPITGGLVLLAGISLGIEKNNEKHTISEVERISYFTRYIDRNSALAIYGTITLAMSLGAGIGEEYLLRNYLMPLLDHRYGQKKGLLYTSLGFGLFHLTNAFLTKKPDYRDLFLQVGVATIGGYFLGKDVQNRNYNIGPAVAAHVWYDFALMLGSFLINPENNILGVNLQFSLD